MKHNTEIWRNIPEFEHYQVSSFGNIKSFDRMIKCSNGMIKFHKGKLLSPIKLKNGYLRIVLYGSNNKKQISVHRLVASIFLGGNKKYLQVNHKDGNKENNCVDNLEWVTCSENAIHAYNKGLRVPSRNMLGKFGSDNRFSTAVCQYSIDGKFIAEFGGMSEASRVTGVHQSSISLVCNKKRNQSGGFVWRFK